MFRGVAACARTRLVENCRGGMIRARIRVAMTQTVIGKPAADCVKSIVTLFECVQKICERADINVAGGRQSLNPRIKQLRVIYEQRFIRTERWVDVETLSSDAARDL